MARERRPRDLELLDKLDALERVSVSDSVWRAVRSGRDPLLGHPSAGRWDPGDFDVLYTSFEAEGAVAELYFHLSRQPVFPATIDFTLNEIRVTIHSTLQFVDLRELEPLGVDSTQYASILHSRTQEIGDAAAFLGFDGIIAPSARWPCLNLTVFSDHISPGDLELKKSSEIEWDKWQAKRTPME